MLRTMDGAFAGLLALIVPAAILWLVIYTAVRLALRHDRERHNP
jgi:hypothetical protein